MQWNSARSENNKFKYKTQMLINNYSAINSHATSAGSLVGMIDGFYAILSLRWRISTHNL